MKMRVRGYDEHRLKDPYKFWSKVLDTPPRRAKRSIAQWAYVSRIDENTLQFTYGKADSVAWPDKQFCILSSNDTWTLTATAEEITPGLGNRIHALTGMTVSWDRKYYWKHENSCRIWKPWAKKSWPYEKGMQIYRRELLDKDKYIDRVRTIEPNSALGVKRKLKKIYELAPIMARLLDAQGDREKVPYWKRGDIMKALVSEIDLENINAMDAERVYLLGEAGTTRRYKSSYKSSYNTTTRTWAWGREYLETEAEFRHRCIVSGLRKLRERIYSKEGVYQYEPVKN